jgi:hypothetical protein
MVALAQLVINLRTIKPFVCHHASINAKKVGQASHLATNAA